MLWSKPANPWQVLVGKFVSYSMIPTFSTSPPPKKHENQSSHLHCFYYHIKKELVNFNNLFIKPYSLVKGWMHQNSTIVLQPHFHWYCCYSQHEVINLQSLLEKFQGTKNIHMLQQHGTCIIWSHHILFTCQSSRKPALLKGFPLAFFLWPSSFWKNLYSEKLSAKAFFQSCCNCIPSIMSITVVSGILCVLFLWTNTHTIKL